MTAALRAALLGAVVLASGGTVVAAHDDPPGTPPEHDHPAGALRLLIGGTLAAARPADRPRFLTDAPAATLADGVAALAVLPCLFAWRAWSAARPRPRPALVVAQAVAAPAHSPPRRSLAT